MLSVGRMKGDQEEAKLGFRHHLDPWEMTRRLSETHLCEHLEPGGGGDTGVTDRGSALSPWLSPHLLRSSLGSGNLKGKALIQHNDRV